MDQKSLKLGSLSRCQLLYSQNNAYKSHQDSRRDRLAGEISRWSKKNDESMTLFPSDGHPRMMDDCFEMSIQLNGSDSGSKCEHLLKTLSILFPDATLTKGPPNCLAVTLPFRDPEPFWTNIILVSLLMTIVGILLYLQILINPTKYGLLTFVFSWISFGFEKIAFLFSPLFPSSWWWW